MNRRFSLVTLALISSALVFSGCSLRNDASKAAAESEETEKEGNGENADTSENAEEASSENKEEESPERIYVFMPGSRSDSRWKTDSSVIRAGLKKKGYQVYTEFADNDPETQAGQIEDAILEEPVAVIVAPADPYSLGESLEKASDAGISIFYYDELIMDTPATDYFISFDDRESGHMIADRIVKDNGLDKIKEDEDGLTIMILAENRDSLSGLFVYNGILEGLREYYENGVLSDAAEKEKPDILCVPDESLIESALDEYEEAQDIYVIANGTSAGTVQKVIDGEIDAVLFKDSRTLAETCAKTVITALSGEDPEITNYEEYDNGVRLIKTIVSMPQIIDDSNYSLLIDDGYFSPEELDLPGIELTEETDVETEETTTEE